MEQVLIWFDGGDEWIVILSEGSSKHALYLMGSFFSFLFHICLSNSMIFVYVGVTALLEIMQDHHGL